MGNENHHHYNHHHKNYQHNLHLHHRSTFLPLLCSRSPIKEVSLPRWRGSASSFCDDPLSPRISCMGQVKKRNNKISRIGLSTSHRFSITSESSTSISSSTSPNTVKYSNLKKLFSSKNLKSTTTPTTTIAVTTISSCGSRKQRVAKNHRSDENVVAISIENMDPPLPVIKKVNKLEERSSIWQRRSGGYGIKRLQVEQIHHPRFCLHPTSV